MYTSSSIINEWSISIELRYLYNLRVEMIIPNAPIERCIFLTLNTDCLISPLL